MHACYYATVSYFNALNVDISRFALAFVIIYGKINAGCTFVLFCYSNAFITAIALNF